MLPNLVIIGARKCGTTSLHRYLSLHPEIWMSERKELGLFSRSDWRSRLDWYSAQFPCDLPVRGEATPAYSTYPLAPRVPGRIHELIPDARLIYVVGDPLDRITSQWVQWYAAEVDLAPESINARNASRPLDEILANWRNPSNAYVAPSRYATQLEQYLEFFPLERILVVDQAELKARRPEALSEIFKFLEVDPGFDSPEFSRQFNSGTGKRRYQPSYSRLRRRLLAAGAGRVPLRLRRPVARRLGRAFSRSVQRPEISRDRYPELAEHLGEEADRLRSLTGKSFDAWSV